MSQLFDVLFERHGPALNFDDAASLLAFPSVDAARQSRARGTYPVPVKQIGKRLIVSTLDIARFLEGDMTMPRPAGKRGAPTKAERLAKAQAAGQEGGQA